MGASFAISKTWVYKIEIFDFHDLYTLDRLRIVYLGIAYEK